MVKTTLLLIALLCASPAWAQTESALERDPEGWAGLLPPEDLKGWKRVSIPPTLPLSEEMQWRVDSATKTLVCSGKGGHEWLMCEEDLSNFILHVGWRLAPLPGEPKYNSGVGIRLSPLGEIWHQAQTGQGGAYLFGGTVADGGLVSKNLREQMPENRVKPVGEWNMFEIRAEGGTLVLWVNGGEVNRWTGSGILKGHLGFEGDGYGMTFRNIKLKKLP